jgi:hypothetical protein
MIYSFDTNRFCQFGIALLAIVLFAIRHAQAATPTNSGIGVPRRSVVPAAVPTSRAGAGIILSVGFRCVDE